MSGIWIVSAAFISFAVTALLGRWMVPFLRRINFGQTIREIGPKWHQKKNGTPTMGGFLFIIGIFLACAMCIPLMYILAPESVSELLLRDQTLTRTVGGLLMALGFGAIGFLDDYIKVVKKRNLGLNAKQKLILQFLVAAAYLAGLYLSGARGVTRIPFIGAVDLGVFYWIISLVGIVGIVNAVGQAVRFGWRDVLSLAILLTINLGIFNLLPVPGLDGGKLLFLAIEGLSGHKPPERLEQAVTLAGLLLLICLMFYVTMQDISNLL